MEENRLRKKCAIGIKPAAEPPDGSLSQREKAGGSSVHTAHLRFPAGTRGDDRG